MVNEIQLITIDAKTAEQLKSCSELLSRIYEVANKVNGSRVTTTTTVTSKRRGRPPGTASKRRRRRTTEASIVNSLL